MPVLPGWTLQKWVCLRNFSLYQDLIKITYTFSSDDCRFPHIAPEVPLPPHHGPPFSIRGAHRPRPSQHHVNGLGGIEDKLATMNIQEVRSERPDPDSGHH